MIWIYVLLNHSFNHNQLIGIYNVSHLELLKIMLLWAFLCRILFAFLFCKAMYLFLLEYNKWLRCKSLCRYILFILPGCMLRSGIAGSCGKYMLNILRICLNIFQSDCTIFHFHYNVWEVHLLYILTYI